MQSISTMVSMIRFSYNKPSFPVVGVPGTTTWYAEALIT